ncbi:unnamed protein product [Protopolystoma xenopodis]|uniref:FHF complex subunit HOOK-interacting protein C-terminal domain-containing protein n=1 Tax=Protopolystoma xenopodis TaxID=117903 RepID=A0A3S4ZW28_9PLAT|nr:unnamed protein product [Protopolystoma xenopodis]
MPSNCLQANLFLTDIFASLAAYPQPLLRRLLLGLTLPSLKAAYTSKHFKNSKAAGTSATSTFNDTVSNSSPTLVHAEDNVMPSYLTRPSYRSCIHNSRHNLTASSSLKKVDTGFTVTLPYQNEDYHTLGQSHSHGHQITAADALLYENWNKNDPSIHHQYQHHLYPDKSKKHYIAQSEIELHDLPRHYTLTTSTKNSNSLPTAHLSSCSFSSIYQETTVTSAKASTFDKDKSQATSSAPSPLFLQLEYPSIRGLSQDVISKTSSLSRKLDDVVVLAANYLLHARLTSVRQQLDGVVNAYLSRSAASSTVSSYSSSTNASCPPDRTAVNKTNRQTWLKFKESGKQQSFAELVMEARRALTEHLKETTGDAEDSCVQQQISQAFPSKSKLFQVKTNPNTPITSGLF